MRQGRFSLRVALVAIVGIGLALAALRGSTDLWRIATVLVTWTLLAWATLGAILLRGKERASWLGIAVFGFMFSAFTLPSGGFFSNVTNLALIEQGLGVLGEKIHPDPVLKPISRQDEFEVRQDNEFDNVKRVQKVENSRTNFVAILVYLINIGFSLMGGLAGRWFAARIESVVPATRSPVYTGEKEAV